MNAITEARVKVDACLDRIARRAGLLFAEDVRTLAEYDRTRTLLIRFGQCRLMCSAGDAEHIIDALTVNDVVLSITLYEFPV